MVGMLVFLACVAPDRPEARSPLFIFCGAVIAMGVVTGGALALRMAVEQPERISALVTIGGFDRVSDEAATILKTPGCETVSPEELAVKRKVHANGDEQIHAIQRQFCDEVQNTGALTPPLAKIKARTLIAHRAG